jgi:hypothetical protein
MGDNRRFVDEGGEGFLEDRLQDYGAIQIKSIMFIDSYALVLPKTITGEGKLHYRCSGLKLYWLILWQ